MANPRSAAAKRLLKGAQQQRQTKNKKATASTMKNMKSVAKGTYANRSNSKAAEANVKSPVKATKKPATKKATTKKTNYDSMSFSKAFAAARKAAKAGGSKTFPWRGKTYGTKLKSEVKAKVPKKKVDVTPKSSTPEIRRRRAPGKDTGPVTVPERKDTKVYSSKTTFANKSRKYAGQTGKSSTKPATSKTKSKGKFKSAVQPTTGKPGIYKKPKATTRKPYETKAGPAQPVAKPRAATKPKAVSKPKAKPAAKKKSSGSAIGRFERKMVRGMNKGIRRAKRAVRRALK